MPLSADAVATLCAVLDRLIPRDAFPGAIDAGVDNYVLRQLASELAHEEAMIATGLHALDLESRARHDQSFASLAPAEQDAMLHAIESSHERPGWGFAPASFFDRLVNLAAEGFYADPANGGNRDAVSWRMIGYDPRTPENPSAP